MMTVAPLCIRCREAEATHRLRGMKPIEMCAECCARMSYILIQIGLPFDVAPLTTWQSGGTISADTSDPSTDPPPKKAA